MVFFSEYLPPCFSITEEMLKESPKTKCDLITPYQFTMSRYNNKDDRRTISIPEIGAYILACNFIKENNILKEIIEFTEKSENSFSSILNKDNSIRHHEESYVDIDLTTSDIEEFSSDYISNIAKKLKYSKGAKYILKLDISNFYSSFYMHMIPTILLGFEKAEEEFGKTKTNTKTKTIVKKIDKKYIKYSQLDKKIRQLNTNKTNGLLTGILISKIIAEGILSRIDIELNSYDIKFSRYVDDYEVYLYDDNKDMIISVFEKNLRKYGFSLNNEKTELIPFPYYIFKNLEKLFNGKINKEIDDVNLMELFNEFLAIEKDGTKGAVKFLLKSLEKTNIKPKDPELYKSYLLTLIFNNERSLNKSCSLLIANKHLFKFNDSDISLIELMIRKSNNVHHDLEVTWLIYTLVMIGIKPNDSIIEEIVNEKNDLAIILLINKKLLDQTLLNKVITDAKSWILLYELYAYDYIDESIFSDKLCLNRNIEVYRYLKSMNAHFCSF